MDVIPASVQPSITWSERTVLYAAVLPGFSRRGATWCEMQGRCRWNSQHLKEGEVKATKVILKARQLPHAECTAADGTCSWDGPSNNPLVLSHNLENLLVIVDFKPIGVYQFHLSRHRFYLVLRRFVFLLNRATCCGFTKTKNGRGGHRV